MNLREQMEPEEKTRFDRQVEAGHQKLIAIGHEHLQLQAFPIGLPDAVPTRQFRKKKTHGLADARGLTGTETAALDLKAREALARKKAVVTPESPCELWDDDEEITLLETPPRIAGVSQGGTTIRLALRPSPEQPLRMTARAPFFRLFPEDPALPPVSTAPPRLEEGRGKRKRVHTDRYEKGVAQGDIDESQHGKLGRP
jgi:hypothetical protein